MFSYLLRPNPNESRVLDDSFKERKRNDDDFHQAHRSMSETVSFADSNIDSTILNYFIRKQAKWTD
jgi:hypothetical protein